jgi:hypothetical protein
MAIVLRLIVFAVIAAIGVSLVAYVFTRERRYLNFAWTTFKFTLIFLLAMALLIILERTLTVI